MKIELTRRFGEKGAWNEGKVIRGDRNIVVDGVVWGNVVMIGHGMHGNSFEFYALDKPLYRRNAKGEESRHTLESVHGLTKRDRRWQKDETPTDERIIAKARELIEQGRLRHPDVIKAEGEKYAAEYQAKRTAEEADKAMIRDALFGCWRRPDLTNAEREGLVLAFRELIGGEISIKAERALVADG